MTTGPRRGYVVSGSTTVETMPLLYLLTESWVVTKRTYLCGDEGHEPLTSGAVLLERLRHVAVQAIDVLEVKVWQEEIIDVLRGRTVAGHQQRHGRHIVVDHDDRVAADATVAVAAARRRGQHVLHVHGGCRRVRDVLHRSR